MLTEEQVIEIEHYCRDHNVSRKSRLKDLNIDSNHFYRVKIKLLSDSNDLSNGKFLQINANGKFASAVQQFPQKRKKGSEVVIRTSFLSIELRNERGTAMRIQGYIFGWKREKTETELALGLTNVLNRHNASLIFYSKGFWRQLSIIPILPSIGLKIKF